MRYPVFAVSSITALMLIACGAKPLTVDVHSPSRLTSVPAPTPLRSIKLGLSTQPKVTGEAAKLAGETPSALHAAVEEQLQSAGYSLVPPGSEDITATLVIDYSPAQMSVFSGSADDRVRVRLALSFDAGGQPLAATVNDDGLVLVPGNQQLPAKSLATSVVNAIPDSQLLHVLQ